MDDELLIETLLYKGEGPTLDYKVQQYPHDGASPEAKGELLKDILAFANAWRQEDAYILIGINNSGELIGLDKDLDDSRLQQFINGKTNAPVHFSYRSLTYQGILLGLYTIALQERAIYAKQPYGKVSADTVYVRRGSSTAIAKPEEIAKMGADRLEKTQAHAPNLSLRIVGPDNVVSDSIYFEYRNVIIEDQENLPDYEEQLYVRTHNELFPVLPNASYYTQLASYLQQSQGTIGFHLQIINTGTSLANDVKIYMTIPIMEHVQLIKKIDLLEKPQKRRKPSSSGHLIELPSVSPDGVVISSKRETITAIFHIGKIQAGETLETNTVYLVRPPQCLESIDIRILSDQLRGPLDLKIPTTIVERKLTLNLTDLQTM